MLSLLLKKLYFKIKNISNLKTILKRKPMLFHFIIIPKCGAFMLTLKSILAPLKLLKWPIKKWLKSKSLHHIFYLTMHKCQKKIPISKNLLKSMKQESHSLSGLESMMYGFSTLQNLSLDTKIKKLKEREICLKRFLWLYPQNNAEYFMSCMQILKKNTDF